MDSRFAPGSCGPFGGPFGKFSYFKQFLRIFEGKVEDIYQKNCPKNQSRQKNELTFLKKNKKLKSARNQLNNGQEIKLFEKSSRIS